jgi:hypothetical protein
MTTDRDQDRLLEAWLAPGPAALPGHVLDGALERVGRTRQRRPLPGLARLGVGSPSRQRRPLPGLARLGVGSPSPAIAAIAAIVVAAVAFAGIAGRVPGPGAAAPFVVDLAVADFAFDPADVYVPAGVPIQVRLTSRDAGVPHALRVADAGGHVVFVDGDGRVGSWSWTLPALPAGRYAFADSIHPSTTGTLHVGETAPPAAPSPSPAASGSIARTVDLTVDATGFTPSVITMPARQRFFVRLHNQDGTARHGIVLVDAAGNVMMGAGSADPFGTFTYPIDALPAGTYTFHDPGHPALAGTLLLVARG